MVSVWLEEDQERSIGGGGAVSLEQFLLLLLSSLAFATHMGLYHYFHQWCHCFLLWSWSLCFRLMTLMLIRMSLLHRSLVSQKPSWEFLSTEPFAVFSSLFLPQIVFMLVAFYLHATFSPQMQYGGNRTQDFPLPKRKDLSWLQRISQVSVSASGIIILFHLAVFSHPQVRYVLAASISTVPGNTKIVFKFGH